MMEKIGVNIGVIRLSSCRRRLVSSAPNSTSGISENRHINFEVAEKIWKKRLSDADSKPPGVPSDLLNFRYTGKFPSAEIEYYDLVLAQEGDKRAIDSLVKRFQPLV